MSRTFKDQKEEKAKWRNRSPLFKRRYRDVLEHGFTEDVTSEICPDCGAAMTFERGFLSCEECNWGAFFPEETNAEDDLEFAHVA